MLYSCAPLEGLTGRQFRKVHQACFPGADRYYMPFLSPAQGHVFSQKELRERRGYLHKCAVCGVTDQDDPNMEFRYCSKCNGYYCYCANHINNHVHVQ